MAGSARSAAVAVAVEEAAAPAAEVEVSKRR